MKYLFVRFDAVSKAPVFLGEIVDPSSVDEVIDRAEDIGANFPDTPIYYFKEAGAVTVMRTAKV